MVFFGKLFFYRTKQNNFLFWIIKFRIKSIRWIICLEKIIFFQPGWILLVEKHDFVGHAGWTFIFIYYFLIGKKELFFCCCCFQKWNEKILILIGSFTCAMIVGEDKLYGQVKTMRPPMLPSCQCLHEWLNELIWRLFYIQSPVLVCRLFNCLPTDTHTDTTTTTTNFFSLCELVKKKKIIINECTHHPQMRCIIIILINIIIIYFQWKNSRDLSCLLWIVT